MKVHLLLLVLCLESSQVVFGKAFFSHSFNFHKWFPPYPKPSKPTYEICYLEDTCPITLPGETPRECLKKRVTDVQIARLFYTLTEEGSPRATAFPIKEIPYLNQTAQKVGFYFSLDKFESHYLATFSALSRGYGENIVQLLLKNFQGADLSNPVTHIKISKAAEAIVKSFKADHFFNNPSLDPSFTEVILNGRYRTDDTFVETLLAKTCPFTIRRVTKDGDIGYDFVKFTKNFSPTFDINAALSAFFNRTVTLEQAVSAGVLFVSHNEEMDGVKNAPDFYENRTGDNTLIEATSPIAIFANKDGILKVLAIQLDYKPESDVLTPDPTSFQWVKAKASVTAMHKQYCDAYMHGGHMHSVGSLFCIVFRRHFSTLHPLYVVFKHHCEGTTAHFALSFAQILHPGGFAERTHGVAHQGIGVLVKQAYLDREFGQMDLPRMLKRLGFSFYHKSNVKYYPFRDDAKEIWKELYEFVKDVVNEFYEGDKDVRRDEELASFAREMASGGKADFTGFPKKIKTRYHLRKTLLSLLWYPVLHGIINYGLTPSFPLGFPIKLYQNKYDNDTSINLGNLDNVVELVRIENLLANLRFNRIMDYYDDVTDMRLKKIVKRSHDEFHVKIQKRLEYRNKIRKDAGRLGIQYLEPKWLPCSIHI